MNVVNGYVLIIMKSWHLWDCLRSCW